METRTEMKNMTLSERRRLIRSSDMTRQELLEIAGGNGSLIKLVNLRYPAPATSYSEFVALCHELRVLEKLLLQACYTSEGSLADAIAMNGYESDTNSIRVRIEKKLEEIKSHPDYDENTMLRIAYK